MRGGWNNGSTMYLESNMSRNVRNSTGIGKDKIEWMGESIKEDEYGITMNIIIQNDYDKFDDVIKWKKSA